MEVEVQEDEVSLLDLLLVVAENIKLLVLGPLLVGLVALGIAFMLPQSYTSVAYLALGESGPEVQAILRTPVVLDDILRKFSPDLALTEANREVFAKKNIRISAATGKKTTPGLSKLEITSNSPKKANELASALIDAWLLSTHPKPETKIELERRLKITQDALESVSKLIARQTAESAQVALPTMQFDMAASGASLMQLRNGYVESISAIERQLKGQTHDVVFSPPTLPTEPVSNKKALIAIMATLATGFALLLFVFMRQAWRNAAQDPESAPKIARLRAAFGSRKS